MNNEGICWPPPPVTNLKPLLCLAPWHLDLVVLLAWILLFQHAYIHSVKFLLAKRAKGAGGQWLQFYLVWGERAVPPPSCELSSNEMEMLSGLPGTVPALCSTDKVATLMGVWLLLEHGSNSSSATVYQLAPAINVADCLGVYQHNSCATERTDVCVCCRLNKGGKTNIFCFKSHGGKVKWKSKQQTFYLIQPLNLLNIWKVDLKDRKTMRLHAWIVHRAW